MNKLPKEIVHGTGTVVRVGVLDMQVCVPNLWTDTSVELFANMKVTQNGWKIRKEGDKMLNGDKERVQCDDIPTNVHIMLDA